MVRQESFLQFVAGNRSAEEKALDFIALHGIERCELVRGFHAFGHHFEVETLGDTDDRMEERMSVAGCLEIVDKGFVDLEGGERKELEVAEGRVAGAEIIDGNGNPHFLEHEEHLAGLIGILHHHPFGQFEFEMVGGKARFFEDFQDSRAELFEVDAVAGDIDAHAAVGKQPGRHPLLCLSAGFPEDPVVDLVNKAALLGKGEEFVGGD